MCNEINDDNLTKLSYRAGTFLQYNRKKGNGVIYRDLDDIAYIKQKDEDDVYIAVSQSTGFTALGNTAEQAYSSLIFKLCDSLREVIKHPKAQIGSRVSKELEKESLNGTRMPEDRQMRALRKGIDEFLSIPRKNSKIYLRKIESNLATVITTKYLEDTRIGVEVFDTAEPI